MMRMMPPPPAAAVDDGAAAAAPADDDDDELLLLWQLISISICNGCASSFMECKKPKPKPKKKDRLRANGWRQTNKQMSFNGHIEQRPVVAVVVGATRLATLPVKWFMPQARQGSNSNSSPKRRARSRLWLRLWLRLCLSLGIHAQLRDLATNFLVRVAEKLTVFCLRWILPRIHLALVAVEHWEKCVVPAGAYLSVFL